MDYFSHQPLFTAGDAKRYLTKMGSNAEYSRLLLHNLVKSGRLFRIKKGFFAFSRNEAAVGFAFRPFYYGMEYALTIRRIWTQQSNPVIITTSKANPGVRDVLNSKVVIRRINSNAFFGFESVNYSGMFVPVSLPEKILLDFIYYGTEIDVSTCKAILISCNRKMLKDFASRMGKKCRSRVTELLAGSL